MPENGKPEIGWEWHGKLFNCTTAWLRARTANTTPEWVRGHAGIKGNEEADKLAAIGARQTADRDKIDLRIPADMITTGAMLAKVGQSVIYHHLTSRENVKRSATRRSVEKVKIAAKEMFDRTPTEGAIWESIGHRDISKKIRDFLWKHMHGIYRLGKFWNHIPGCGGRVEWPICGKYDI